MFHLPIPIDGPTGNRIVMFVGKCGDRRSFGGLATYSHELIPRWLHIPSFVPSAALQNRRTAIPTPRNTESRKRLAEYGFLQRGFGPSPTPVGRDHHFRDPSVARIRETGYFIKPGSGHRQSWRWMGDEGFD